MSATASHTTPNDAWICERPFYTSCPRPSFNNLPTIDGSCEVCLSTSKLAQFLITVCPTAVVVLYGSSLVKLMVCNCCWDHVPVLCAEGAILTKEMIISFVRDRIRSINYRKSTMVAVMAMNRNWLSGNLRGGLPKEVIEHCLLPIVEAIDFLDAIYALN